MSDIQSIVLEALVATIGAMVMLLWKTKPSTAHLANTAAKIREDLRREFEDKLTATVNAVITSDLAHDKLQIDAVNATVNGLKDQIRQSHDELRDDIREVRSLVIKNGGRHGQA